MTIPDCAIVLATICIPWTSGNIDFSSSSIAEAAEIRTSLGRVVVFRASDGIEGGFWEKAARACEQDQCSEYIRRQRGLEVTLVIRRADCDVGRRVVITGRTPANLQALLEDLAAIPPHGDAAHAIPLARLSDVRPGLTREERMRAPQMNMACSD